MIQSFNTSTQVLLTTQSHIQGPAHVQEVWEEGYALAELQTKSEVLAARKAELEQRKKKLANVKRGVKRSSTVANSATSGIGDDGDFDADLDITAETESLKAHVDQLKKDEAALVEEKRLLDAEKAAHQKELKRCYNEDQSRFQKELPFLHNR